jgi:hypothetical protein
MHSDKIKPNHSHITLQLYFAGDARRYKDGNSAGEGPLIFLNC